MIKILSVDDEITPTLGNLVVLIWLRLIHEDLPRLVQQRYGTELRSRTLATMKPEIFQALDSLLDKLHSNQEVREMRTAGAQGCSIFRPQEAPSQRNMNNFWPICKQEGRADFRHYLSAWKFLPEGDRRFMARAHALQIGDEDGTHWFRSIMTLTSILILSTVQLPMSSPLCCMLWDHWAVPLRWFVLQTPSHPGYPRFGSHRGPNQCFFRSVHRCSYTNQ